MLRGKVLIFGSTRPSGSALARALSGAGEDVIGTTRRRSASNGKSLFLDLGADVAKWRTADRIAVAVLAAAR